MGSCCSCCSSKSVDLQTYDQISNNNNNNYKNRNQFDIIPNNNNHENDFHNRYHQNNQTNFTNNYNQRNLSPRELQMVDIANQNKEYFLTNPTHVGQSEVFNDEKHDRITRSLQEPEYTNTWVIINQLSTIETAIQIHEENPNLTICLLNFADAYKPGGGYLNGRSPQEETLCRQTLLYPTLTNKESLKMYENNKSYKDYPIDHDDMIYSSHVEVIRDDDYNLLPENQRFYVNIISSNAVDNRHGDVYDAVNIMQRRIRRIIHLAAFKNNDVLVLGAFGCGIFKNDPKEISYCFRNVLIKENMKDHFQKVIFAMYRGEKNYSIFKRTFGPHKKRNNQ